MPALRSLLTAASGFVFAAQFVAVARADVNTLLDIRQKVAAFVSPVQVVTVGRYRDGGTISLDLQDAKGSSLIFCIDGRANGSPGGVFVNAAHPDYEGSVQVEDSDPLRNRLLALLDEWVTRGSATEPEWKRRVVSDALVVMKKHSAGVEIAAAGFGGLFDSGRFLAKAKSDYSRHFPAIPYTDVDVMEEPKIYVVVFRGVPSLAENDGKPRDTYYVFDKMSGERTYRGPQPPSGIGL